MKKIALITSMCFILAATVNSQESKIGYKEFYLGQAKNEVKNLIKGKYGKVTFFGNEDMKIETGEMVYTSLFFDHTDKLFYIKVEIKSGETGKVKERLIEKYGQPNDYPGEEFNRGIDAYLMGRWLEGKRYKIALWESDFCRGAKITPCIVYVDYIDLKLKEAKEKHEINLKFDEQKKKDSKTYDGF